MSSDDKLFIHDRWTRLVGLLNPTSVTSVEALSESLRVSMATVRRDLNELDAAGELRRVRGGAIAKPAKSLSDVAIGLLGQAGFEDSASAHAQAKMRIGIRAAKLLSPDEAVIIDGGSTTLQMARNIGPDPLTVLTTSIPILYALLGRAGIRVLITGGEVYREQNIVLNPYSDNIVANFSATKIFMGAQAITRRGLMQTDPLLVQNEKDLIASAEEVIVLADSSKFRSRGSLAVCDLARISAVITDAGIPDDIRGILEDHDVTVVVADD